MIVRIDQPATPPRFGTRPLEEGDDLFSLREQVCADCGGTFSTSRHATRCALCASLRSGQVGPATVECPVCRVEHQIPVLAPHKLCGMCALDLPLCAANVAADVERAQAAHTATLVAMEQTADAASTVDVARYSAAVELRRTLTHAGRSYTAAQAAQMWEKASLAGDGLSALLRAHDARAAAEAALSQAQAWASVAREEIAAAKR